MWLSRRVSERTVSRVLTMMALSLSAAAQDAKPAIDPVVTTAVTVDLAARTVSPSLLPFGRRITLRGTIPERPAGKDAAGKETRSAPAAVILMRVAPMSPADTAPIVCESWSNEQLGKMEQGALVEPNHLVKSTTFELFFTTSDGSRAASVLPPNTPYRFDFLIGTSKTGAVVPAPGIHGPGDLCTGKFADLYPGATLTDSIRLYASTGGTFEDHFKVDVGVGVSYRARYSAAVTALHFYLLPVDRAGDLNDRGLTGWQEFRSRTSVFGGLTLLRFTGRGTTEAPRDFGALITGLGLRSPFYGYCVRGFCLSRGRKWLQPMRFDVGRIFLQQKNANPAIEDKIPFHDLFASVAFDAEISSILGPLGKIFK